MWRVLYYPELGATGFEMNFSGGASDGLRVVVIEDHALVREAVGGSIAAAPGMHLSGEAGDGASGVALVMRTDADVAVIDFALPDMTGVELIDAVREAGAQTRFLILTGAPLDADERKGLAERADGFLHKEAGQEALIAAVREAAASPPPRRRGASDPDGEGGLLNAAALSPREREVLREIARGRPVDDIARRFEVSAGTVRKHRENIMAKLGLNSTAQLVRAALQIGQY